MPLISGVGAVAGASAAGAGAFGYNRGNYMFDSGLRFKRYMAGYGFAEAQAAQYREDIRDLTEQTCAKQDLYHVLGIIFYVLSLQLIMAGRMGIHGPAPPGWMLGIYFVNSCSSLLFLCTLTWLSLHAGARASAGAATLLTRSVRLPIPTPKMMDKARMTGNSFEKERATDIFRVPFAVRAPKEAIPEDEAEKGTAKSSNVPASRRRMPKWHQDEQRQLHQGDNGATLTPSSTPEHFELYCDLQQEFAAHDCYARIGILYFLSCFLASLPLYSQGHCFAELRAIWPAWTVSAIFCTAHYCVLQCDIVFGQAGFALEKVVPWMPMLTVFGMSLDYSVATPSSGLVAFIYFLSFVVYLIHFLWSVRMYQLAQPHPQAELPDDSGPWCPPEWQLPRAFLMSSCIVSPPKSLEPGVPTCLQLEMKAKGSRGASSPHRKARHAGPSFHPWRLFRGALITYMGLWVFLICGRIFEIANGERNLFKMPGRVLRWPAHMQPWITPWTREKSRNEWAHTGGSDRRLQQNAMDINQRKLSAMSERLLARLAPLAVALEMSEKSSVLPQMLSPLEVNVAWPADLQPSLLAAFPGEGLFAALNARERRGAVMHLPRLGLEAKTKSVPASQFSLGGIDELGELIGASWAASGLIVATRQGAVAECAGRPDGGVWPCRQVGASLPSGGSAIKSAVVARLPGGLLRAAITFTEDEGLLILELDLSKSESWIPTGEVRLPQHASPHHHFAFGADGHELIMSARDGGAILKWRVGNLNGVTEPVVVSIPQAGSRVWHGACGLGNGRLAHLASQTDGSSPELLLSSHA
ncbi:unnamed protein product [Polarella glacialis]|uniref:Uncharacterized protein n=1 Tax=Polarella glacialis TaxID=89957 RepID=A0A813IWW8_POLGL|nr:unnamed protein product [Polarella glacialis]